MSNADVTVTGNLTRDAELRFAQSGNAVCNMSVAVNHRTKKGEDETSFLSVVVFGDQAENVASLKKGNRVMVKGRLRVRTYEKKDESVGTAVEVLADEVGPSYRWATGDVVRAEKSGPKSQGPREYDETTEPF